MAEVYPYSWGTPGCSNSPAHITEFKEARPSWATWSRTGRPNPWRRFLSSPFPSRNLKSLTFSWGYASRMRFWRLCPCKSRPTLASGPGSVAIWDYYGHVGLSIKCSKEVARAILGAIILIKLSIVPVWQCYWEKKTGRSHTVPARHQPPCWVPLPTPRGTGIISASALKKLLLMASMDDCHTSTRGCTANLGDCDAISKTYSSLTLISEKRLCSPSLPVRNPETSPTDSHQSLPVESPGSIYGHHCSIFI